MRARAKQLGLELGLELGLGLGLELGLGLGLGLELGLGLGLGVTNPCVHSASTIPSCPVIVLKHLKLVVSHTCRES